MDGARLMAECLIRVVDKVNSDFYLNTKCTKRGDVIVIQPDGWNWGIDELGLRIYRIIQLPEIDPSDLSAYLAPELDVDPQNPSRTLQRRAFFFDLNTFGLLQTQRYRNQMIDDNRIIDRILPDIRDLTTVLSVKVAKLPIIDPNVIGVP